MFKSSIKHLTDKTERKLIKMQAEKRVLAL